MKQKKGLSLAGLIIGLFLLYVIYPLIAPFSNVSAQKYNSIHISDDNVNVVELNDGLLLKPLKYIYRSMYGGHAEGIYFHKFNKIILFNDHTDTINEIFFHEYLHHIFYETNLEDSEIELLLSELSKSESIKNDMEFIRDYAKDNKTLLKEYIGYTYMDEYNKCRDTNDKYTTMLLNNNLLPRTIYCNKKD